MSIEAMKQSVEAAYLAGFNASGEGYNGEYPFGDKMQDPAENRVWKKDRDNYVSQAIADLEKQEHGSPEDMYVGMHKHLNCPHCGGSGHIDDVADKQEPVAWMQDSIELYVKGEKDEKRGYVIPLYDHPQPKKGYRAVNAVHEGQQCYVLDETAQAEAEKQEPVVEADLCVMVGYSKANGGYFVYEETTPQEFCAIKGPFTLRLEAEKAMRDPNSELIKPQPAKPKREMHEGATL